MLIVPTINRAGIITVIIISILVSILVLRISNEKAKWESVKCQGPKHLFADFIGEDSKKTYKECNTKEAENQIDQKLIPYRERQDRINLNIEDLKTKVNETKGTAGDLTGDVNTRLSSLAQSSTTTISQIKDSLSKLLGAIFLSTKINDNVLHSVEKLNEGDLARITKSFNNAVTAINK